MRRFFAKKSLILLGKINRGCNLFLPALVTNSLWAAVIEDCRGSLRDEKRPRRSGDRPAGPDTPARGTTCRSPSQWVPARGVPGTQTPASRRPARMADSLAEDEPTSRHISRIVGIRLAQVVTFGFESWESIWR